MPDYEDITLAGQTYRFFTKLPALRMMQFRSAYRNAAKKIIYASMLEMGEIANAIGYQMIGSPQADRWITATGFEEVEFIRVLCAWMAQPLEFKEDGKTPKKSVFDAVVESGEDGINILKFFFIGLTMPIGSTAKKPTPSISSSKKAGPEKKTSSRKTE